MTPGGSTDKLELGCGDQTPTTTPTLAVKPQRKYSTRTPAVFIGSTDFIRKYSTYCMPVTPKRYIFLV